MILVWRDSTPPGEYTYGEVLNYMQLTENFIVNNCEKFPEHFPDSTVDITTQGSPADFFFAGNMFIASEEMVSVFKSFNIHAEYFQLKTRWRGTSYADKEFYFVNILDVVECFDYERSKYGMSEKGPTEIEHLVLDENKSIGHHLFMVGPISPEALGRYIAEIILCVSDELAKEILCRGLSGVAFVRPKDWRVYPATAVAWTPEC